jgi:hypothetical protein
MQTGSPKGALKTIITSSPGKHPISINFNDISSSLKESIIALSPHASSESFRVFFKDFENNEAKLLAI